MKNFPRPPHDLAALCRVVFEPGVSRVVVAGCVGGELCRRACFGFCSVSGRFHFGTAPPALRTPPRGDESRSKSRGLSYCIRRKDCWKVEKLHRFSDLQTSFSSGAEVDGVCGDSVSRDLRIIRSDWRACAIHLVCDKAEHYTRLRSPACFQTEGAQRNRSRWWSLTVRCAVCASCSHPFASTSILQKVVWARQGRRARAWAAEEDRLPFIRGQKFSRDRSWSSSSVGKPLAI